MFPPLLACEAALYEVNVLSKNEENNIFNRKMAMESSFICEEFHENKIMADEKSAILKAMIQEHLQKKRAKDV